ncbi:hypothetical protein [Leisingera sp. JC1]|uniref:hypothetical protein n=1 Tax=Leisingera sp. JC1 TaxID=1855282 RepID=UPI001130F3C3|nr:hypothetical protein [Leisingera sp. JC1]
MTDTTEPIVRTDHSENAAHLNWWWNEVLSPLFTWMGEVIGSLFPWALLLVLFASKDVRISLISLMRRLGDANEVQIGGMKFNLTNQEFEYYYDAYSKNRREKLIGIFDDITCQKKLVESFENFVTSNISKSLAERGIEEFRSTIHIISPHDKEYLYQLTEYYPESEAMRGVTNRGRMTSIRFGITGRAIRDGKPHYDGHIRPAQLISLWGMTRAEAESAGKGELSMLSMPILNIHHEPVACVFVGVKVKFAFGSDENSGSGDTIQSFVSSNEWKALSTVIIDVQKEGAQRWSSLR